MKYCLMIFFFIVTQVSHAQIIFKTPPGTIRINDSLYIDNGPVDNLMYKEFINRVQNLWNYTLNDSLKSLELEDIDDSLLSRSLNPQQSQEIYEKIILVEDLQILDSIDIVHYFNHPKYQYYPMIGVSKEQAQLYCEWRTDLVNLLWGKKINGGEIKYNKIKYRLPTRKEYSLAKNKFRKLDSLVLSDLIKTQKIDLKSLRKKGKFFLYDIPEFTSAEKYPDRLGNISKSKNNITLFRCICEVQK